jgi:hypothetical protein
MVMRVRCLDRRCYDVILSVVEYVMVGAGRGASHRS